MSSITLRTNLGANAAVYSIRSASQRAADSTARLSSGSRIVRPADDAAGLAVGTKLKGQLAGLRSGLTNMTQASSMMQTASGGISQILDILDEQKALAVAAQNGSLSASDRSYLVTQFQTLTDEIDQIANATNFNGVNLLSGGMGNTVRLANTNALAAAFTPATADGNTATTVASTTAIQAFNISTGASMAGTGAAGKLDVTDSGGTVLANGAYDSANSGLHGQFSSFRFTNVSYGVSATLTATINGVEFSGTVTHNATTALLNNGSTYIKLGATAMALTNAGTVAAAEGNLSSSFANTSIMRTSQLTGINFAGTTLSGVTGAATTGISQIRSAGDPSNISIGNFRYMGSSGADANVISADVNGKTFTATAVEDAVDTASATSYTFESGDGEAFTVNITGLTTAISNIRTSTSDRQNFIDALNIGFSRAGGGLTFADGFGNTSSMMAANYGAATSAALFNNTTPDLSSAGSAITAESAVDNAIANASAIQASIGAYQESFDFTAGNLSTAILGIDEARATYLDADVAEESTNYALAAVQTQAGVAVLAQANQLQKGLLALVQAS